MHHPADAVAPFRQDSGNERCVGPGWREHQFSRIQWHAVNGILQPMGSGVHPLLVGSGIKTLGYCAIKDLLNTSWRALVSPLDPMPPLYSRSQLA